MLQRLLQLMLLDLKRFDLMSQKPADSSDAFHSFAVRDTVDDSVSLFALPVYSNVAKSTREHQERRIQHESSQ